MLPRLLLLTDRRQSEAAGRSLLETVDAAVGAGAAAVLVREKDLPRPQRRALLRAVAAVVRPAGGLLLVASDVDLARDVGADGVHLAAADPWPGAAGALLVGRSCHSADDVVVAGGHRAHHVTLSPVHPTDSKPGYGPPLSIDGLRAAVGGGPPVFALGGVRPGNAAACVAAGAAGVAVMGAVMAGADPAGVVASLIRELDEGGGAT